MFASDAILASQFVAMRQSVPASYRPIQKLMLATLMDALDCFLRRGARDLLPSTQRARLRYEAERWFFDESAAGAFSFNWICDGLGLDASYLRAGIGRVEARKMGR